MADSEMIQGPWEKADVIGKILIPISVAFATLWFNSRLDDREADRQRFEVAVDVLRAPTTPETRALRGWALDVFKRATGSGADSLSGPATNELRQGAQLPSTATLSLPTPGPVRVSIIRLQGASTERSDSIRSALIAGGYAAVSLDQRASTAFPDSAEVRYYHPGDADNARALSQYIAEHLGVAAAVRDKSRDPDAAKHSVGELHVYIR